MKYKYYIPTFNFLIGIFCLLQPVTAQTDSQKLTAIILERDSLFWKGYNTCDTALCGKFLYDDVTFYHDKGGPTLGRENLLASLQNNLCGNIATYRLRREAIKKIIKVFPMLKNGAVYGAIFSGEHFFFVSQNGQKEKLDGRARFTHLWLLQNGIWKMSYILSYDHGPATGEKNQ
jgi:hypothetical protein